MASRPSPCPGRAPDQATGKVNLVDLRLAVKSQGADLRGHEWLVVHLICFWVYREDYGDVITVTVSYIDTRNVT